MLAPVRNQVEAPPASTSRSSKRAKPRRAVGAGVGLAALAASVSFGGCACPLIEGPVNASPALQWFLFSNFGAQRICPEMMKQGVPLRLQANSPAIGRFFPMQCQHTVNDSARSVTVSFAGTGYGYISPAKRVGFSVQGSVDLIPSMQIAGDDVYVYGRLGRIVSGPNFNVAYIENPVVDVATNIPPFGSIANFLGQQVVAGELTKGFTVVHNDKGDDFALGLLNPPSKPNHPFNVTGSERFTFANETVDVHQNQRDYLGPFEVAEAGRALYVVLNNQGPAVDVMVVNKYTGDVWRDQYQRGIMTPPPGPVLAGAPLQQTYNDSRRYPLPQGSYYIVIDNTASAGIVSPPASLIPLADAVARVSYVVQLGE